MMKVCSKCKKELSYDNFHKNKNSKDGLNCWCKDCVKKIYADNRDERLKYQKDYKNANEERFKEQQKRYKTKVKEQNKEKNYQKYKMYEKRNKEKLTKHRQEYFQKNKDKILDYNRKYIKQRRNTDELFLFKHKVRILIYSSFKRKNLNKKNHTTDILGCDFEELKNHLYKTFFDNYGYEYNSQETVHIDHIIPLATANTEEEVIKLCHYKNLQLLKASDNLKKSAKTQ